MTSGLNVKLAFGKFITCLACVLFALLIRKKKPNVMKRFSTLEVEPPEFKNSLVYIVSFRATRGTK